jgi:hypothetical protein
VGSKAEKIVSKAVARVVARHAVLPGYPDLLAETLAEIGVLLNRRLERGTRELQRAAEEARAVTGEALAAAVGEACGQAGTLRGFRDLDASRSAVVLAGKTAPAARNGHVRATAGAPRHGTDPESN